jgi:hypothetical protein
MVSAPRGSTCDASYSQGDGGVSHKRHRIQAHHLLLLLRQSLAHYHYYYYYYLFDHYSYYYYYYYFPHYYFHYCYELAHVFVIPRP